MRSTSELSEQLRPATPGTRRLVVCWQHPTTRAIEPVGLLSYTGREYRFVYLARASEVEGFIPLLGFPDLTREYESDELFALFAQRVMDPRRPDFSRYLQELAVSEEESTPWELLARTQGQREGDTILLYPVPEADDEGWHCHYLVHGVRYMAQKSVPVGGKQLGPYSSQELEQVLSELRVGDPLELCPEPTNEWSPGAILVLDSRGRPIGYLPDLLTDVVERSQGNGSLRSTVEKVNGPEAGWHLRVLVRLDADAEGPVDMLASDRFALAAGS